MPDQPYAERRRSPRVTVSIPVVLIWDEDGEHREHTFTTSVSWYGCAVRSHRFFSIGSRVRLQRGSKIKDARVIHCMQDQSTKMVEVGLGFDADERAFWGLLVWAS
jgi:hypothetical protein